MEYRKDIQVLRGVAVLLVVCFHLEIAGFNSGFLGVDVFFVISGYLMAIMYDPAKKLEFFIKRAKRLLPAYFAVLIFTLIAAIIITKPTEYNQVSNQALFATFFASNIGFWMENSYFDKAAFKPLLHLWSLGVEIQFYLIIPILCWFFRMHKVFLPLILIGSLLMCILVVGISPKTAFFWLPFRLWEFLLGFMVSRFFYKRWADKNNALTWLGTISLAITICIPLFKVDGQQLGFMHGHPGLVALLISITTAMTLAFGVHNLINKNYISSVLERVGGYSYSIYLAHFPVIVLFLYQPFAGTLLKTSSMSQSAVLVLLVAAASFLLFKFVEQPFRKNGKVLHWMAASVALVIGICSLGTMVQKALIPERDFLIYQAWFDRSEYRCGKIIRITDPKAISCEITRSIDKPSHRVLFVGNSHADAIKTAFSNVAQAANLSVYFMVDNTPLVGGITPEKLMDEVKAKNIDVIVLHYSPKFVPYPTIEKLARLAKEQKIILSFIMPVPVWNEHIPEALIRNITDKKPLPHQNITDYQQANIDYFRDLSMIDYDKFKIYPVADVFCQPDCQLISGAGKPLYFDSGHVTLTGSEMLAPVFSRLINDLN